MLAIRQVWNPTNPKTESNVKPQTAN